MWDNNKRNFSEILAELHRKILTSDDTRSIMIGNATMNDWADFIDKNHLNMAIGELLMEKSGKDIFIARKLLQTPLCEILKFNCERVA